MGGYGGNQGMGGNQGGYGQGGMGGYGNQGGMGGNQGGMGYGNQGGMGGYGNQGGMGGNQGGMGMGGNQGDMGYYDNSGKSQYKSNPYQGLSHINEGPNYYAPSNLNFSKNDAPKKFGTFDSVIGNEDEKKTNPIYPSVNPNTYELPKYEPGLTPSSQQNSANQSQGSQMGGSKKDPTISQIMREFDVK